MALMLGYDAVEEMVAAIDGKVINTIHPDDREQVIKDIGGEYYEGLTYETTYRMLRKDGSWFWTVDKEKVIRTEDGKLAIISACYDMTSFVERHKKLEAQNMLSQATIDNISGGYHRCSLEDSNRILNERNRILSALSRDYTTVLLCDLKQDTFEVVKGDTFAHNDPEEKQQFDAKWSGKYPKIAKSWKDNWANLSTYFKYPEAVRRLIYTTNTIEGFNRQLRKVTKSKTVFPSDDSLLKMLYLAMIDITKKWTGHRQDWGQIHSQLEIFFEERLERL